MYSGAEESMWYRQEMRVVRMVKGACGTDRRREYLGWKP